VKRVAPSDRRARFIAMVADGDICIVRITARGLRFGYSKKGRSRLRRSKVMQRLSDVTPSAIMLLLMLVLVSLIVFDTGPGI
jgi:hypothetical protein